ncbi:MAG: glycosyltransferase [Elusimicrobia bacterium]|nr:glycosyltransferase [Elusimicrobiota bacterium]
MRKVNILYLANTGDIIGGGEINLCGILEKLNKEIFNPIVICPFKGDLAQEVEKLGIEVKIVQMGSLKKLNPFAFVSSIRAIIKILKNRNINLVHANGSRCAIYGGLACKIVKAPMIWHVRILESDGLLDRFLAKISALIIVNSNAVKKRFEWMKEKNKIAVIYSGIDVAKFSNTLQNKEMRKKFGLSSKPVICSVGRLDWYKAHQYLLYAAKKVVKAAPDAVFLIIGDGEKRKYLENLKNELKLDDNVIFIGDRKDIPEILAGIDVFVLSSISEGFGRSVAEAMSCEKPVVATRVGGLCEVVDDGITGILVPPKDPLSLAEAIVELLKNKRKAKDMGIEGRKRVERIFDIEKSVRKTENFYKKILNEKSDENRD